jgi:hypothetical protein
MILDDFEDTIMAITIMLSWDIFKWVLDHTKGKELRRLRTLTQEQKEVIREQQWLIIQYEFQRKKEDEEFDRKTKRLEILSKIQIKEA